MQAVDFPASAASSLIDGYCTDFVSLAASLAQTLEQVSMRAIALDSNREALERTERGMRDLAEAIHDLLRRELRTARADAAPAVAPPAVAPPVAAAPAASRPPAPDHAPPPKAHSAAKRAPVAAPPPAAVAAAAPAAKTDLVGTSQTMPLMSVFQFLGRMRKNGCLRVRFGQETILFEFAAGCVQAANGSHVPEDERLGNILVEMGFLTPGVLAEVTAKNGTLNGKQMGTMLVDSGHVSNGQVIEALERQVHKRFRRACRAPNASYEFTEGDRSAGDGRVHIFPMELVHATKRRGGKH